MFRRAVPNCPALATGSGRWNARALSQALTECGPLFGLPTKSGRCAEKPVISGALPCRDTSFESNTVNGVPLISVTIPLSCHVILKTCLLDGPDQRRGNSFGQQPCLFSMK